MITSKQNSIIKAFNTDDGLVIVEGAKLVCEALKAGFIPKIAVFTEKAKASHPELFEKLSGTVITPYLAEYISDTKTPQGISVKFERKRHMLDFGQAKRVVIFDGVQDPGNAGAIIRSCEAFGLGVIASKDSVDPFNSKVVRASAGSVFRLPCPRSDLCEQIAELKQLGFTIYAAALDENATPLRNIEKTEKIAVVIGNEGRGVSDEIAALCDRKLYIPIRGAESLNASVAAGIICYELGGKV